MLRAAISSTWIIKHVRLTEEKWNDWALRALLGPLCVLGYCLGSFKSLDRTANAKTIRTEALSMSISSTHAETRNVPNRGGHWQPSSALLTTGYQNCPLSFTERESHALVVGPTNRLQPCLQFRLHDLIRQMFGQFFLPDGQATYPSQRTLQRLLPELIKAFLLLLHNRTRPN
jgi:hypothetical protein